MPQVAITDDEIAACFEVMSELRPHIKQHDFVPLIRQMEAEGYRLAFMRDSTDVVAVAGYRISTNFFLGKHLYVDDLVTASKARSRGYGEQMIRWLRDEAKNAGCNFLDLDSGTHRGRAHRFYFAQGFTIASYHFSKQPDD